MTDNSRKQARIPATRFGRFARLGLAAGELALGGVTEGLRNVGRTEPKQAYSAFLTAGSAKKLAHRLAGMRGAAMKMGQLMSMESADFLPKEFADALAILRNSAYTMPDSQLRRVLGQEYGKGWEDKFESFDFEPVAAASIGQVHRARTRDGRDLALKIQYPGVAKSINSDVDNMAMLLRVSKMLPVEIDVASFTAEIKRLLRREADYVLEADNLKWYGKLLEDNPEFLVPAVHSDYSSKRILAMDYVEGVPVDSLEEIGISQKQRSEIGRKLQELVFRELFEFRTMQSDPNFANYLYQPKSGRIVLLDFGATVSFERAFSDDYAGIANALIDGDDKASRHYAEQLGYLSEGGSNEHARIIIDLIAMVCEPIRTRGVYDFAGSDLFSRARETGMDMFFNSKESYVVPPPETTFLHRKLMGSFLLCTRLGAKFNVQELIQPYLTRPMAA